MAGTNSYNVNAWHFFQGEGAPQEVGEERSKVENQGDRVWKKERAGLSAIGTRDELLKEFCRGTIGGDCFPSGCPAHEPLFLLRGPPLRGQSPLPNGSGDLKLPPPRSPGREGMDLWLHQGKDSPSVCSRK